MNINSICIDPGHGGRDNGATYGHIDEKDINLAVAYLLRCVLQLAGFDIVMTRDKDVYVSLEDRCQIANVYSSDIFLSLHCDAWHKQTTQGISAHVFYGANHITWSFGECILNALMNRFPDHANRGLKLADFCVLKRTRMPAVLVECEFISNPDMREFLHNPENQFSIANAILNGVENARRL